MNLRFLISGLIYFISFYSYSQNNLLKHLGIEEGLASNNVYAAFQDSKGYIWLSTSNGVSRFDGKEFRNFTTNNGLPDNEVFSMEEDALGRIWLSCYNGEPCYVYKDRIYTRKEDSTLEPLSVNDYLRFRRAGKKLILTKSGSNTNYLVSEDGRLQKIQSKHLVFLSFKKNVLTAFPVKRNNSSMFFLLDSSFKTTDSLIVMQGLSKPPGNTEAKEAYAIGENGFVVVLKNDNCLRYSIFNNRIVFLGITRHAPKFKCLYTFGTHLWINAYNRGIVPVTSELCEDPGRPVLFSGMMMQNFLVDREGNFWGCTAGKGLYLIPNSRFSYYFTGSGNEQEDIVRLATFNEEIFVGSANGIFNYRKKGRDPFTFGFCPQDKFVDLYTDSLHVVAANAQQLILFDKKTRRIQKLAVNNIKCMRRQSFNSAVFGTHSSCYLWSFPNKISSIFQGRILSLCPRENGDILIGTLFGLFVAKKTGGDIWHCDTLTSPNFLKQSRISCIAELDRIIVIGTAQKGLVLINGNDYEKVDLGEGFRDINCKSIFIDKDKTIWLGSFSGVFKIKLLKGIHSYTVQQIRKFNGLLSDDVNDIVVVNDTAYVAGSKGLTSFCISENSSAKHLLPTIYIDDLHVNNATYPALPEVQLPFDSSTIVLHVSAIDYRSQGNILFKYKLNGIQKEWQFTRNNTVRFEALPAGTYTFEALAMNSEGQWSTGTATMLIRISPAWWQSSWFYLFLMVASSALIYFIARLRLTRKHRRQIREASLKRHLAELELRAIKAQINPHFIFNTLNAIQYFINNQQNEKAEDYINRLADLLRRTLEFSDKTTVPVHAEIRYLENYLELERLRFDENFEFSITNKLPANQQNTEIPPMVLQPHIENALRHAFKNRQNVLKRLDIRFRFEENQLICEVQDNGIGRAATKATASEENRRSRGTELSHAKLQMYESITGKTIKTDIQDNYAEDQTSTGTLIRISITQ